MTYIPQPGAQLTVTLPGEVMRAMVTRLIDRNTVLVEIGQPMAKSHNYRKDDIVACRRKFGDLGEFWEAFDDRIPIESIQPEPEPVKARGRKKVAAG